MGNNNDFHSKRYKPMDNKEKSEALSGGNINPCGHMSDIWVF